MKIIADLHLHSKYSRAVSQEMNLENMAMWGKKKGIGLLATGDWTHPIWLREIKANLEEVAPGLYGLKEPTEAGSSFVQPAPRVSSSLGLGHSTEVISQGDVRGALEKGKPHLLTNILSPLFILSTEISSIYSQNGKSHRIHIVVLAPSIETVEKINKSLVGRGANLMSDGRPITGISAPELVKIILSVDEKCLVIPAHVWTPWFSLYGSESGFDSINECFGEMGKYIYAVETGLSSDPLMNWRISELDNRSIVSSSDAHSGPKLGREATVFEMEEMSYENIRKAIVSPAADKPHIAYTLEFYPEEGKYHYTGHRDCHVRQSPEETSKLGELCPVCGRHLTVGVMHRVEQLAKNTKNIVTNTKIDENGVKWIGYDNRPPYAMLVPLQEILAESLGSLPQSQNIKNEYEKLTASGISGEFGILLEASIEEIAKISGPKVAEGIKRVRSGQITVDPGYDGVFGVVKIWGSKIIENEQKDSDSQMSLF